jgi:DNA-directed RNA polymerase alpha subunit
VLRKEGEGPVTAADIQTPHDVEIVNPEHVIANLAQGGKLDMQIKVEKGRGYVPGNLRRYGDEPTKSIGRIVLDASFSPVRRVSYAVENARVEQRTDLDKLVMEIETNGAISPRKRFALRPRSSSSSWPSSPSWTWRHRHLRPAGPRARPCSIRSCCARSTSSN